MGSVLATARGWNGQVELLSDRVRITRKGFFAFLDHGLKGAKEIPISQISAVEYREAGFAQGYIRFAYAGASEPKGRGLSGIRKDENSVTYTKPRQAEFTSIKEQIDAIMGRRASV